MTDSAVIDGARLLSWARRTAQLLDAHREEINSLNVFPVPDSDTGSNMAHTMSAAVGQAETLEEGAGCADIASALAVGSIKGARGNSGVVLSQVLRGVAQAAAEGDLDGSSVADALANAVFYVERAINDPVEGTIVTVLREAATAAGRVQAEHSDGEAEGTLAAVVTAAVNAAEQALEQTPSQLAELREAGVVDAGGRGLVLLLTALRDEVAGTPVNSTYESVLGDVFTADSHGHTGWLEIMFFFTGPVDEVEAAIATMGTSLVVARASDSEAKIHIHSTDAGAVIERAYELGSVTDLRLEILPDETSVHDAPAAGRIIVALTPPGSVSELYRQAGAVPVNPGEGLASQIQETMGYAGAHELVVLPNGHVGPVELEQIAKAVSDAGVRVAVLSTEKLVGGIAALAVHDPRQPLEAAAAQMDEAAADMRAADIVRTGDSEITVAALGTGVVAADENVARAVDKACRAMLESGGELVTLLLDPDVASELDVEELEESLGAEILVYPADGLDVLGQIGVE